ncbi:MAG: hypothetical protein HUU10_09820 [Bacteroidetes bacterium]|nr:hypothetical protein [Bacteroidota bacterium]
MTPSSQPDFRQDLAEIRTMMERSSKFKPLVGLSGVLSGCYALAGSAGVWWGLGFRPVSVVNPQIPDLVVAGTVIVAILVLLAALITSVWMSWHHARRIGTSLNSPPARRMIGQGLTPLVTGGVILLILLSEGLTGWMAPVSMIFYGLAMVSASPFTLEESRWLGLVQIVLGLAGLVFPLFGILLWALGFGVVHIGFGWIMSVRYNQ